MGRKCERMGAGERENFTPSEKSIKKSMRAVASTFADLPMLTHHSYADPAHVEVVQSSLHCVVLCEGGDVLLQDGTDLMRAYRGRAHEVCEV
jgi:hypothetical protein